MLLLQQISILFQGDILMVNEGETLAMEEEPCQASLAVTEVSRTENGFPA